MHATIKIKNIKRDEDTLVLEVKCEVPGRQPDGGAHNMADIHTGSSRENFIYLGDAGYKHESG